MTLIHQREGKTQIGTTTGSSGYVEAGNDINFATGQIAHIRMKIAVPRKANIQSAMMRFMMTAKAPANNQTCYNSIRAVATGNAPPLQVGAAEGVKTWTAARVEWTVVWTPNPTGDVYMWRDVAPVVQEIVNRSDYEPGGYISFMVYTDNENGSDMGFRANHDFSPTVQLHVSFSPTDDMQYDVNLLANPNFDPLPQIVAQDRSDLPFWSQSSYFGAFVDPANHGLINRDTSFTRVPGVPTLRFTTGTPPGDNKLAGPMTSTRWQKNIATIFAGWIYVPSYVTTVVRAGDPYLGNTLLSITARDTWVPFCTNPTPLGSSQEEATFWPAVYFGPGWQAGWQFWLSEPTILHSPFRKMPFNAGTPDILDGGQSVMIDHRGGIQTANRQWLPRRAVLQNGSARRYPTYTKGADGILRISEPVKGGPTIEQLGSGPLPSGKTFAEL